MRISSLTTALFGGILLFLSNVVIGDSILAFAPITALFPDDIVARQLGGACPAATQTPCPDGLGCCPRGAACSYSSGLAVCDEPCGLGPKCASGGCCQLGYVCGVTNQFCTPGLTSISVPTFPVPTFPVPSVTMTNTHAATATGTLGPIATTSTSSPGQGVTSRSTAMETPTLISTGHVGGASTSPSSSTSSTTSSSSSSTSTTHTTTPSVASAQSTHTGAASSLKGVSSVTALVFGWIGMLFVA